ncbi:hypothetical protein T265_01509 [Opisthorchis viverrini]|uniref:Uncharacterized protein n=1 Tax=Opisthorchis viverrini TaxID=6198 RepID=A0A075A9M3_OPIVI|nr:hypothetical protein T265_01509 [Opisthorchis viverrini]KER32455.1 hypothetical protein T265_01509 [Opisthorchis viverrini]
MTGSEYGASYTGIESFSEYPDDTNLTGADATEEVTHTSLVELKESSTQTQRASSDSQQVASRGTFGPYSIGSNMKGPSNVYSSAAGTDRRRRNRLTELHSGVGGQTDTRRNRGDLTCPSKFTALPSTLNRAARNRDGQPCTRGGKCDIWLSEYNRQFPVYPTSVYTRSASVAAGRCRPLGGRLSSRNAQPSLVATHPVLLSSRKVGAVVGNNQSNICSCNG